MSDVKRYYWLKLKEDFFDDDTIAYIEDLENGVQYVNFYLKLCLKSLKGDGKLIRLVGERLIPYDVPSLARLTNTPQDTVRVAMNLFNEFGLIKILESGEIYMSQVDEMIGTETNYAAKMRRRRAEIAAGGNNVMQKGNNVTQSLESRDKSIEIESSSSIKKKEEVTMTTTIPADLDAFCRYSWKLPGTYTQQMVDAAGTLGWELTAKIIHTCAANEAKRWSYVQTALKKAITQGLHSVAEYEAQHQRSKANVVDREQPSGNDHLRRGRITKGA